MSRSLFLSAMLLSMLVGSSTVFAAWFGDEYFEKRCEAETKKRLAFPGGYKRTHISHRLIEADRRKYKDRSVLNFFSRFLVDIEFTSKTRSNKTLRNISHCDLTFHFIVRGKSLGDRDNLMEGTIYWDYELERERIQLIYD